MKNVLSTTIIFIANQSLHDPTVETYSITYTSNDEDFEDDFDSFQEYVTHMVHDELDGHAQQFTYAFAMTQEAYNSMITNGPIQTINSGA
jgi:hypothetical protein